MKIYLNDNYENKLIATANKNEEFSEIKKYSEEITQLSSKNEYVSLLCMLKFETRDVDAFNEALDIKQQYESNKKKQELKLVELKADLEKAMQGKSSIANTISGK